ncbi:hypothetical protein V6N13_004294 [Hibiscus sabdariffa]
MPWFEILIFNERATWLEVRGLPLHCWNSVNLKKIVEVWCSFESLWVNANHTIDCEKVTVLITTMDARRINECIDMEIGDKISVISISKLSFSDDSDRPGDKRWKSAKEESDDLKDVESISDVNSPKRGTVGDDRCSSGTELDAIKAMCAKREYDDYFHREKNGLGSRRIGEEGLGGSSKKETADCGNRNEEGNKENGVKNVLGVEIEEEGCIVASEFRVDPKPVANLNKSGKNPFGETHRTWASRLINSGGGGFGLEIRKSRR